MRTYVNDENEIDMEIIMMLQCNNFIHNINHPYSMESVVRVPNAMYCRYTGPEEKLKFAYDKYNMNKQILSVFGEGYLIEIDGNKIVNYKNELYTDIELSTDDTGTHFIINKKEFMCGEITLVINEPAGKYLYLYNDSKKKYELIYNENIERLSISIPGKYLITDKKIISGNAMVKYIIGVGGIFVFVGIVFYVLLKKRYWFW